MKRHCRLHSTASPSPPRPGLRTKREVLICLFLRCAFVAQPLDFIFSPFRLSIYVLVVALVNGSHVEHLISASHRDATFTQKNKGICFTNMTISCSSARFHQNGTDKFLAL